MGLLHRLLLILCACSLPGCADPRSRAEGTLHSVGAKTLRSDAAVLYKQLFAGRGAEFLVVRESQWPSSFKRFAPARVGAYPDGLTLALHVGANAEAGLYVVPLHMENAPSGAPGASYRKLAEGIYWYSFAH